MPYSVAFDPARGRYVVRRWGRGYNTRKTVPPHVFTSVGADPFTHSRRGEKIAEQWAAQFENEERKRVQSGVASRRMTLAEIYAMYHAKNPELVSAATLKRDRAHAANLIEFFGSLPPDRIDDSAVLEYRNKRLQSVRARTVGGELSLLRRLLQFGYASRRETGMRELSLLKLPRLPREEGSGVALTFDEFKLLMAANPAPKRGGAHDERVKRIIVLGVVTMLRRSNLLGLRTDWIDFERRWLTIPARFMKGERGRKQSLSVPLCDVAMRAIGRPKGEYVFENPRTHTGTKEIRKSLTTLCANAGIREISHHDLRTTGSTWLVASGVNDHVRKYLLGHRLAPIEDAYVKPSEDQLRAAVAIFDELFVARDLARNFTPTGTPTGFGQISGQQQTRSGG